MKKSIRDAKEIESLEVDGLGMVTRGLRVLHQTFGPGTVVAIFELPPYSQTRNSIGIEFDSVGYKPLAPQYAKLQRHDSTDKQKSRTGWLWLFRLGKR